MPIVTDTKKIDELLTRGVAAVYPSPEFLKSRLASGKRLRVYLGIDPTGSVLHLGHSIVIRKLAQFQSLGHEVILLIGDFTAIAGDPDKTEARKIMTRGEILANCKNYKRQASRMLKFTGVNAAQYKFNSAWLSKLGFADVIKLGSQATVQRMLERDLFERRIRSGNPLYVHEFMYPLMQGYDSVAMDVDGELGATDQTFNMLTGRDLMKRYKNKEKFVLAMKLLEDPSGKKMGKTEGNMVTLVDSPGEMFGKIMSWTDGMIVPALELLTDMTMEEIQAREREMKSGKRNPRDVKAELARLVVSMFHPAAAAKRAEDNFEKTFQQHQTPDDIPVVSAPRQQSDLADFLSLHKLAASKSEARRLIEQGAVKVNQKKVGDWKSKAALRPGDVVQVGKRKFVRIR